MKLKKKNQQVIFAIDPSPNGTACVKYVGDTLVDFIFFSKLKKWEKMFPGRAFRTQAVKIGDEQGRIERTLAVKSAIYDFVGYWVESDTEDVYIGLEDYVWGSGKNSGGLYQMGELGGQLRITLGMLAPLRTYDPVTVKLARCGKGTAGKEEMMVKALEELEETDSPVIMQLNDLVTEKDLVPPPPGKKKSGYGPFADVADAMGVAYVLRKELAFRRGEFQLSDEPEHIVRVFNRVTKAQPNCLIDRPFMRL